MNALDDFGGYEPVDHLRPSARSPLVTASAEAHEKMHNGRGLVAAVLLSAACWALIGLALFA